MKLKSYYEKKAESFIHLEGQRQLEFQLKSTIFTIQKRDALRANNYSGIARKICYTDGDGHATLDTFVTVIVDREIRV